MKIRQVCSFVLGSLLVTGTLLLPPLRQNGFEAVGPLLGIVFVVFSLFGQLPRWLSWTTKVGSLLYPGIAIGTVALLFPLLLPSLTHASSFFAFSPAVWLAYISIVLVGISFETSTLPLKIYQWCKKNKMQPYLIVPLYVVAAGLLGNILDGVSIIVISTVIFLHLLSEKWAVRSLFALLFGGLISNLITVAAEPTNIKFQDVAGAFLSKTHPSFWVTNWPICLLGILFPAFVLMLFMKKNHVAWNGGEVEKIAVFRRSLKEPAYIDTLLALVSSSLLGLGILLHTVFSAVPGLQTIPLWLLLLPAGIAALNHLLVGQRLAEALEHVEGQLPVWVKLAVIFSLLWFLQNGLSGAKNVLALFSLLPSAVQYVFLLLLSLTSPIVDNVALAAIQGTIILAHPIAFWETRVVLLLLTWAGGFTPFGCLQSLGMNQRLQLSTRQWIKETPLWAGLALAGGLAGLVLISFLYP